MMSKRSTLPILAGCLIAAGSSGTWAQLARPVEKKLQPPAEKPSAKPAESAPRPTPPDDKPAVQPPAEKPKAPPLPSLDELLGLSGAKPGGDPADPSQRNLDRLLTGAEVGDAFKEAAALMGDAAERLQQTRDTGLVTQRVQDDIVKRLDQLISSLENMQQQSSSSSSSSQQQSRSNQSVPNQQSRSQQQESQGENRGETEPPGRQDGALRPGLEAARAAWGHLPDRVRDMLVQGNGDKVSELYKALTSAYYRKLAEQGKAKP